MLTLLVCGGNVDRANTHLARGQAQRPYADLVDTLCRRADRSSSHPGRARRRR